jgi:hypothetical protein
MAQPPVCVLLPTFRYAVPWFTPLQGAGPLYKCAASGAALCEHGELARTINSFLVRERKCRLAGEPPPLRNSASTCTCTSTIGMQCSSPAVDLARVALPSSPFECLERSGATPVVLKGRTTYAIPWAKGRETTYVTADDRYLCRHARGHSALQKDQRFERARGFASHSACGCTPLRKRRTFRTVVARPRGVAESL